MERMCYNYGYMEQKSKKSIWKKWWFWVGLFFGLPVFLVIMGTIGKSLPESTTMAPSGASQAVVTEAITTPTPKPYVFDVPSLIGKNTDQIGEVLGQYKKKTLEPNAQQIKLGLKEWDMTFEKDGKELLVTYDFASKKVIDFFISSDDRSGASSDKNHLLMLGNLSENDSKYKVTFVKALKDPSVFTGVKVTPL